MSNNLIINPEDIADALSEQLELYNEEIKKQVENCTAKAAKELVEITKETAPVNLKHWDTSKVKHFRSCIASKKIKNDVNCSTYKWYVKAPCYRLTHLLVNGHPMPNGKRYKGDPFLKNACEKVFPEFEENVKKAIKNDS